MTALRTDLVTAGCARALTAAGVPHLLLKGPTTARWLYRDGAPRRYADTDLLVPVEQWYSAADVLAKLGFVDVRAGRRESERGHATNLYRRSPAGLDVVDLHHRLRMTRDSAVTWDVLSRDAEETIVGGARVRMPGAAARCVVLALHAAQNGQWGEQSLADLRRALDQVEPQVWLDAWELAGELDARPAFRLGCLLARRPATPGAGEATGGGYEAGVWRDTPLHLRLCAIGVASSAHELAGILAHRGAADRLRFILGRLFPSRQVLADVYGARTPASLPLGYARRYARIAANLPAALRDVRAANRATVDRLG
ncbi:MAG TPA: nucleotidyltransferase family protein [Pilimelia sp.]|nr:nucleotidyltransferase family protein [Pilimelia sp.]